MLLNDKSYKSDTIGLIELLIATPANHNLRTVRQTLFLFTILLSLAACDHGPSGGSFGSGAGGSNWGGPGAGGGGGGGTTPSLTFDGPISADPASPTSVAVQWHAAAVNTSSPEPVLYDVFRADAVDMLSETLVATIDSGATSWVDSGLTDGQTYFYRVLARTTDLASDNADVVSAHLPQIPAAGMDYETSIAPLWSMLDHSGTYTCLDCHDGTTAKLDLTSWEGLVIGVGNADYPNSFVIPAQGRMSFNEGISRILSYPTALPYHRKWRYNQPVFDTNLVQWINEGAQAEPDVTPPTFNAADFSDPEKFSIEIFNDERFKLRFPHASDPESVPYINNTPGDHLEYRIYGGMDSNSIDWENPLRTVRRMYFPHWKPKYEISVLWPHDHGVFVVRAVDFLGNQSLEEAELVIERPKD